MDPLLHDFKVLCRPLYCVDKFLSGKYCVQDKFLYSTLCRRVWIFLLLTVLFWQRAPPEAGVLPGSSHSPGHPQKIQVVQVW